MFQHAPQLFDAIERRRSHRHYLPVSLNDEHAKSIQSFIDVLQDFPFSHSVKLSLHEAADNQNIVYFQGPKHFVSLITTDSLEAQAKLGFLGELIVLFAESLDIKTCWMGHYKKKIVQDILIADGKNVENQKLYCIITLGYIPEKTGLMDRFSMKRLSRKSKTVDDFLHTDSLKEFPQNIRAALEKASRAPSAMNSQKWYYLITEENSSYQIELAKPPGYRHFKWSYYDIDVGTAASHIWIGLQNCGINPNIEVIEESNRAIWKFHLDSRNPS
ncbi:MAG: nitroreductase family protein [Candidatus Thorarchaeota archaeon]